MSDIRTEVDTLDVLTVAMVDELDSYCSLGSVGMMNSVADCLIILKERIASGNKIMRESTGNFFTNDSFKDFVEETFPTFVINNVYSQKEKVSKSYFDLKNTKEGLDVKFNSSEESCLVESICAVSSEYELVRLVFNNVVYIRHIKSGSLTPMVSENGGYYVYDILDGKIKEIFRR